MTEKPTKSEGMIYPCDTGCTKNHELLSTEKHWKSREAPESKIIRSSKYEMCSIANKIR